MMCVTITIYNVTLDLRGVVMKNYDLKLDSGWKFHLGELPRIDPDKRLEMSHWTSQGDGMLK